MLTSDMHQRIIDYSLNRIFTFGYSKTTMDEISSGLKISKKTLYQHFNNKFKLFEAVIDKFSQETTEGVVTIMQNNYLEYTEKLEKFLIFVYRQLMKISSEFINDIKDNVPKAWELIESVREKGIEEDFGQLIEEGKHQGLINNKYENTFILDIFLGAAEKVIKPEKLINSSESLNDVVQALITIILHGILKPPKQLHEVDKP